MKVKPNLRYRKGLAGAALVTFGLAGIASVQAHAEPRYEPCPANNRSIGYYDDSGRTDRQPVEYFAKRTGVYRGAPPRRGSGHTLVRRETFNTRVGAQIVLTEYYERGSWAGYTGRGGRQLVCRVSLRGPDARAVPYHRLERVATSNCARQARVVIN